MDQSEMMRRHRDLVNLKEFWHRVQRTAAQNEAVVDRQIGAYDILLGQDSGPSAVSRAADVERMLAMVGDDAGMEMLLAMLAEDAQEDAGVEASTDQPSDAEPCDGFNSDRVSEEDLARYRDCRSLIEIADRSADIGNEEVYVAQVTDIAEAKGLANLKTMRPRKQLWLRVYSALQKSERFEYGGRGTGRFTRLSRLA